ncbi:MAG: hypothetical protein LBB68_10245 [Treponema sp.]|jgi:hypothetical protein|nr:hypothetical protein [Treponema sp.]
MNTGNNTLLPPLKKAQELRVLGGNSGLFIEETADELQKLTDYDTTLTVFISFPRVRLCRSYSGT